MTDNKPKKLIVFCDGTWNKPDESDQQGKPCPTNVAKMFRATAPASNFGEPQIAHYISGVGTHRDEKIRGGAFGFGISDNIKDGYQFICSNYQPGDEIYLFGFSRGAYTARSLAGLIHNLGILHRAHFELIDAVYDHYRDKSDEWHPDPHIGIKTKEFREKYTYGGEKIHFLGVWDTVGALGAPYGVLLGWLIDKIYKCRFHDTKLSSTIESAYHALSKDEKRWPFRPTLWELSSSHNPANFEEHWFDGVHSDVGGGYADAGLSDKALEWMASRVRRRGLQVDLSDQLSKTGSTLQQHDSQHWYYQWATLATVKWPALLLVEGPGKLFKQWPAWVYAKLNSWGFIAEADIREKIAAVDNKGDFHRLQQ